MMPEDWKTVNEKPHDPSTVFQPNEPPRRSLHLNPNTRPAPDRSVSFSDEMPNENSSSPFLPPRNEQHDNPINEINEKEEENDNDEGGEYGIIEN
jgi:hypothetical protein